MSWQDYIDNSLIKSNHVDKGAIYGLSGESKWAATAGFDISSAEIKEIINCLSGNKADKYFADGLYFGGERYVVTKVEGRSLNANKGKAGIIVCKCAKAIIIAHYHENMIAGNCSTAVQKLADYLIENGF